MVTERLAVAAAGPSTKSTSKSGGGGNFTSVVFAVDPVLFSSKACSKT